MLPQHVVEVLRIKGKVGHHFRTSSPQHVIEAHFIKKGGSSFWDVLPPTCSWGVAYSKRVSHHVGICYPQHLIEVLLVKSTLVVILGHVTPNMQLRFCVLQPFCSSLWDMLPPTCTWSFAYKKRVGHHFETWCPQLAIEVLRVTSMLVISLGHVTPNMYLRSCVLGACWSSFWDMLTPHV